MSVSTFYQCKEMFLVKEDPIVEHRVMPKPRCSRAVDYRLDVVKEVISIRSAVTQRRRRQAECSVEHSALRGPVPAARDPVSGTLV